jgi:hypothetical protein
LEVRGEAEQSVVNDFREYWDKVSGFVDEGQSDFRDEQQVHQLVDRAADAADCMMSLFHRYQLMG